MLIFDSGFNVKHEKQTQRDASIEVAWQYERYIVGTFGKYQSSASLHTSEEGPTQRVLRANTLVHF